MRPSAGTSSHATPSGCEPATDTRDSSTPSSEKEMSAAATPPPRSENSTGAAHSEARLRTWRAAWRSAASATGPASAATPPVSWTPPHAATGSPRATAARSEENEKVRARIKGDGALSANAGSASRKRADRADILGSEGEAEAKSFKLTTDHLNS